MAQIPNLDGAVLNLNSVRDQARGELVDALDSIAGKKVLVLDPKLSGPLALIVQTSLLKEHGVENLYHLSYEPIEGECQKIMYLVRPRVNLMRQIASQIRADVKAKQVRQYHLFFMPRRTIVCEKVLEEEGVYADVTLGEYTLDIIPFDEDVLSLELATAYKESQVDGDRSVLYYVARALTKLQTVFGVIPLVKGKGRSALAVAELLPRMRREQLSDVPTPEVSNISMCILLDRQVDMVTPLCTQLTYEGLLDEFLQINNASVEVDPLLMGVERSTKKIKVPLNSSDKLFRELRDVNFGVVGPMLRQKATSMKQDYADVTGQNQSVSDLKDFVKKLNALPEMTRHTNLAQHLSTFTTKTSFLNRLGVEQSLVEGRNFDAAFEYVEEAIQKQENLLSVLRLLCLFSLTSGGLPKKQFDHLRRELLHSYGFEHLFTLDNLEKAGLLRKQEGKSNWQAIKRSLRLAVDDLDEANPNDIAYTYSGYAPMSIRLIQQALSKGGWKALDDVMRSLPGPHFEREQSDDGSSYSPDMSIDPPESVNRERPVVLVVFIGGVTFAEISALRFLSSQENMKYDFVTLTTKLINGNSLLQTLVDDPS